MRILWPDERKQGLCTSRKILFSGYVQKDSLDGYFFMMNGEASGTILGGSGNCFFVQLFLDTYFFAQYGESFHCLSEITSFYLLMIGQMIFYYCKEVSFNSDKDA